MVQQTRAIIICGWKNNGFCFIRKGFNFQINEGQEFRSMACVVHSLYNETQNYLSQIRVLNSNTNQNNTIIHLWHCKSFILLLKWFNANGRKKRNLIPSENFYQYLEL